MNLAIKLTSLTSLILTSPRILQCLCSANSSKKKKKKKRHPCQDAPPPGFRSFAHWPPSLQNQGDFFYLPGVLALIMLQIDLSLSSSLLVQHEILSVMGNSSKEPPALWKCHLLLFLLGKPGPSRLWKPWGIRPFMSLLEGDTCRWTWKWANLVKDRTNRSWFLNKKVVECLGCFVSVSLASLA